MPGPSVPSTRTRQRRAKVNRDWHIQLDTIKYSVPHQYAGQGVDVRIIGSEISILADSEIIATHQHGAHRNGYVTDTAHAPAHFEDMQGLWTRAYFLRQAAKVGPGCVAAITRLLDGKAIEAQGFRSCMNILDLGKHGSRQLLEHACQQVCDEDPRRQISYTAIRHRLTVLRARDDERPRVDNDRPAPLDPVGRAATSPRDTSRAHLAGAGAFSLDALTRRSPAKEADHDHA